MADSVIMRRRGPVIGYGILICGFASWLLFSPAGWPFHPPESCTWEQWLFARTAVPLTGIVACVRFAIDESKWLFRADASGFEHIDPGGESWLFSWDEVSQWGLTRGGWRITESEGGTKYENFHPNDEALYITLVGGRRLGLCLPIHGFTKKSDDFLALLRRYVGDREAPVVVVRCDPARRPRNFKWR